MAKNCTVRTAKKMNFKNKTCYGAFHRFGQAKFPEGGSVLGSSQFSILPRLPMLGLKVVKIDPKISNSLC
jgi:hypothetical protein